MKTDWKVGDQAYVWCSDVHEGARELVGAIILVELLLQQDTKWKVRILLPGSQNIWIEKGIVKYVTPDELYTDPMDIHKHLCTMYSQYLLDQVSHINNHWNEQYDPSRIS